MSDINSLDIREGLESFLIQNNFLPFTQWNSFKINHMPPEADNHYKEIKKQIKREVGDKSGLYVYVNEQNEILYVGKGKPIYKRILSHFNECHEDKESKYHNFL